MERAIYFDMDGTIVNLYGVENWLLELQHRSCTPYKKAAPLIRMQLLARLLNELRRKGWTIGIVSWLAKNSTTEYDEEVTRAKLEWLSVHLKSVEWDEIHIVSYGTPKEEVINYPKGILFDDEEPNRNNWKGIAYNEKDIIEKLKAIR